HRANSRVVIPNLLRGGKIEGTIELDHVGIVISEFVSRSVATNHDVLRHAFRISPPAARRLERQRRLAGRLAGVATKSRASARTRPAPGCSSPLPQVPVA